MGPDQAEKAVKIITAWFGPDRGTGNDHEAFI